MNADLYEIQLRRANIFTKDKLVLRSLKSNAPHIYHSLNIKVLAPTLSEATILHDPIVFQQ